MTTFVLRLYDYLHRNRWLCYVLLAAIVVGSVLLTLRLRFNEDISDFLPNDEAYQKSMSIYRQINAADRIFVVFQLRDSSQTDTEKLISAVELFGKQTAGEHWKMTAQVDYDKLINIASFVYRNAPLFLSAADYNRMERQLAPDSIASAPDRAYDKLLLASGSLVSNNIQRDPLGLFTPLITRLQTANSNIRYALNDGFIFTPDNKRAITMIDSPYGSSETSKNTALINRVNTAASAVEQAIPGVQIQATGAPVLAVQNARPIKTRDSRSQCRANQNRQSLGREYRCRSYPFAALLRITQPPQDVIHRGFVGFRLAHCYGRDVGSAPTRVGNRARLSLDYHRH